MIHIKIDDTIVDVIAKMESVENGNIILNIPVWHPLLHNYVSLKIIKNKVPKWKKLIIITSDRLSRKIWQSIGIEYSLIRNKEISQKSNTNDIMKDNFSLLEYLLYELKYYKNEFFDIFKDNRIINSTRKLSKDPTPLNFIVWLLIFSVLLFITIYYLAISKTFVSIKPELSVRKEVLNFTLTEQQSSSILAETRNIQVEPISKVVEVRERFWTSIRESKDNKSASWKIRIYNYTTESISLRPQTRFLTEDELIFTTDSWVQIPAWIKDNFWSEEPWVMDIVVSARALDNTWAISGERWNISSNTLLSIPWLPESMQEQIYAETLEDFVWWSEEYISRIAQDDIDIAMRIMNEKLRNEVTAKLRDEIIENNLLSNRSKSLLTLPWTLNFSEPQITVMDGLSAGDEASGFELQWIIELQWYIYNEWDILQRLRRRVNERQLDGIEKILHVDPSSLKAAELLSRNSNPFRLKASFEVEVISEHDFLHDNNTYVEWLKERIRWVDIREAERILLNDIFVSYVEIQNRPFFRRTVSTLPRNIYFRVQSNER